MRTIKETPGAGVGGGTRKMGKFRKIEDMKRMEEEGSLVIYLAVQGPWCGT